MGCTCTTPAPRISRGGVSPAAAQSFFNLEGLPLSLTVEPVDRRSLRLRIVGLDCVEELRLLEAALKHRGLMLRSAVLLKIGAHVDQTFELVSKKTVSPVKNMLSPSKMSLNEVKLDSVPAASVVDHVPSADAAVKGVKRDKLLRLSVQFNAVGSERGVVLETMQRLKQRLVCATVKTEGLAEATDIYWMVPDGSEEFEGVDEVRGEFQLALFDLGQRRPSVASNWKKTKSKGSTAQVRVLSPDREMSREASLALADQINAKEPELASGALPIAIQGQQRRLEYRIHGPSTVGLAVDGFHKYIGVGLVERSIETHLHGSEDFKQKDSEGEPPKGQLVLEMSTFFVPTTQAESRGSRAQFSHLVSTTIGLHEFAHFVTWLDIASHTWTIDKVFLNGVLPSGKSYGSKSIAEHLVAPPELFFPTTGANSSFVESVPELEKIVVLDIVNWNTYLLMANAGMPIESTQLGDVLDLALQTELNHAKLSREQLAKGSALEIFQKTALGKVVGSVIRLWNQSLGCDMKMASAEVRFGTGYEHIFGEERPSMAVVVKLAKSEFGEKGSGRRRRMSKGQSSDFQAVQTSGSPGSEELVHSAGLEAWGGLAPTQALGAVPRPVASPTRNEGHSASPPRPPATVKEGGVRLEDMGRHVHVTLEAMGQHAVGPPRTARGPLLSNNNPVEEAITSAGLYFAGVSSAMTVVLHEIQLERGFSCRAAASGDDQNGSAQAVAKERMRLQRLNTDRAFTNLLSLLKMAPSLLAKGTIERRHTTVLDLQQVISIGTLMCRRDVDDVISEGIGNWMARYLAICTSSNTGYHLLCGKLLRGIVEALKHVSESFGNTAASHQGAVTRCSMLLQCKEQVGQERAMLAAKGRSRWEEVPTSYEVFEAIKAGTYRLRQIITQEEVTWSSPQNKLSAVDSLMELHSMYERERAEETYSIPAEKAVECFATLTEWIDAAFDQIQEEIEAMSEQLSHGNGLAGVAQPSPAISLRSLPVPAVDEGDSGSTDEALRLLISEIRANKFSQVVVMSGAGISVSANLPDFRSPGGLYDQLRKTTNITAPETIFTGEFLNSNPGFFFEVMQRLRTDHVSPTLTHCFVKLLSDKGVLRRWYTQNIDCLERKVGVDPALLVECHGTMASARCHSCSTPYTKEDYFIKSPVPTCDTCGGPLRPDIVLFGENLAGGFMDKHQDDFREADLIIIMGSSLQVQPFASLPKLMKSSCALLLVNRVMPESLRLHRQVRALKSRLSGQKLRKEVFLQGDCDISVRWLTKELAWGNELAELTAKHMGAQQGPALKRVVVGRAAV